LKKTIIYALLLIFLAAGTSSCGYLIAAGAGAAGGYILKDQGYEVQSPVAKDKQEEQKKE